jgi:hypothetical protein
MDPSIDTRRVLRSGRKAAIDVESTSLIGSTSIDDDAATDKLERWEWTGKSEAEWLAGSRPTTKRPGAAAVERTRKGFRIQVLEELDVSWPRGISAA